MDFNSNPNQSSVPEYAKTIEVRTFRLMGSSASLQPDGSHAALLSFAV